MYLEIFADAFKVAITLLLFLTFIGYGPAHLLLTGPWAPYRVIGYPIVGWIISVPVAYFLNATFLGMNSVFWVLMAIGFLGNSVTIIFRKRLTRISQDQFLPLTVLFGLILFVVALIPHANDSSLGLIALNVDEELYWPYAEHIKHLPASMNGAAHSPFSDLFSAPDFRARGQGFVYLLSLASIVSVTPTFLAYMPLIYTLLALSVISTYLFARVGMNLGARTSLLAAGLYAINGLPLWFSGMGFGPHMVAFVLLPIALASLTIALNHGTSSSFLFAGLISAVLLISYFWAISAVFLVSGTLLAFGLILFQRHRMLRIRRLLATTIITLAAGSVGFYWLLRWALPRLNSITGNLDASFGNAWGDLSFPPFQLAPGIQTYHMVFDRSGVMAAIPDLLWNVMNSLEQPLWMACLISMGIALLKMKGNRLVACTLATGFALFMLWVFKIAGYQYGHFKNLSYISFFVDTLIAAGFVTLWDFGGARFAGLIHNPIWRRSANTFLRFLVAFALIVLVALSLRNSLHTFRWYWLGFSWNMPHYAVTDVQRVATLIPKGATVAVSSKATYPLRPETIKFRPITLAFHYESSAIERWSGRLWALLATELPGRHVYLPNGTTAFATNPELIPQQPDYWVLGRDEDPRLHGLLEAENLTQDSIISLYRNPGTNLLTHEDLITASGGKSTLASDSPLVIQLTADGLSTEPANASHSSSPDPKQLLFGMVNMSTNTVAIVIDANGETRNLDLDPGLHWITTNPIPPNSHVSLLTTQPESIIPILARSIDPALGINAEVTQTPHAVVRVQANAHQDMITARITFINPLNKGRNVGVSYHEQPTRGYWVSAMTLPTPQQRMILQYSVSSRQLNESLNNTYSKTGVAREAFKDGQRTFYLVFAHGEELDHRLKLFDYTFEKGSVQHISVSSMPYIFTLRDR